MSTLETINPMETELINAGVLTDVGSFGIRQSNRSDILLAAHTGAKFARREIMRLKQPFLPQQIAETLGLKIRRESSQDWSITKGLQVPGASDPVGRFVEQINTLHGEWLAPGHTGKIAGAAAEIMQLDPATPDAELWAEIAERICPLDPSEVPLASILGYASAVLGVRHVVGLEQMEARE